MDSETNRILIHEYAKSGQADLIAAVVEEGTAVDLKNSMGDTALHWASRSGHVAAIETLLKHKADIGAQNNQGDSALHLASFKNHKEACKVKYSTTIFINTLFPHFMFDFV